MVSFTSAFEQHVSQAILQGSAYTIGSSVVLAAASLEFTGRAIYNFATLSFAERVDGDDHARNEIKKEAGRCLGIAVMCGLCASNLVPGISAIAATIFVIVSTVYNEYEYSVAALIGTPIRWLFETCLSPVLEVLGDVAMNILSVLGSLFAGLSAYIDSPIWVGVVLLTSAILIYQYVLPAFSLALIAVA